MKNALSFIALGAVCIIAIMVLQGRARDSRTEFNLAARAAEDSIARLTAVADSAVIASDSADARRLRAETEKADAEARADAIAAARRPIMARIASTPVPESALPYTAGRDAAIAMLEDENAELRTALAAADVALNEASTVADNLRAANGHLERSVALLSDALDKRPKERAWMPTLGLGLMAGICTDLRPCSGAGITLAWKVMI